MDRKVYPSAEELIKVNKVVHCTEEGCDNVFSSESNLTLHLAKKHKKEHLMKSDATPKEFHCPEASCIYNFSKSFKTMKLLKQHYLKVHADKNHICNLCHMGFSSEAALNRHIEYCGVVFKCSECDSSYSSYETLMTHARRKKHAILEKGCYKPSPTVKVEKCRSDPVLNKKGSVLLPKGVVSLLVVNTDGNKVTFEKSSQTEEKSRNKSPLTKKNKYCLSNSSSQTTNLALKSHTSSETQTVGDYCSKKMSKTELMITDDVDKKSIRTQTHRVDSETKSCNTSFNMNEMDFVCEKPVERNSSSTQTVKTIPTELIYASPSVSKDLNFDIDQLEADSFFNCHMETQTDFILGNDLLNQDYYSNMYTQTCDDVLFNDLGFSNIHTQTVLDEMLRSVESQTLMSQNKKPLLSCRHMAHMETQTDEFQQMLEEINA